MTITLGSRLDQRTADAHSGHVEAGQTSSSVQTISDAPPLDAAAGTDLPAGQRRRDAQTGVAGGDPSWNGSAATITSTTTPPDSLLADPFLALAADVLDDAERTHIANANRLRQLTRSATDKDGEERGFGLDESHPDVARLAALVGLLAKVEHDATLNLQRHMRRHPLGPWCKAQHGIGEKQAARLLAAIGDPYWNTLYDRPRTVSELWAYCGYKPGQKRQKGVKSNWSSTAKMRAYLIAEKVMMLGHPIYRPLYDARRDHTALTNPEWSKGHSHNDALRIVAKEILADLWREAKRIHEAPAPSSPDSPT